MARIAKIGNKQRTWIDWAKETYKRMAFGQDCNIVEK